MSIKLISGSPNAKPNSFSGKSALFQPAVTILEKSAILWKSPDIS